MKWLRHDEPSYHTRICAVRTRHRGHHRVARTPMTNPIGTAYLDLVAAGVGTHYNLEPLKTALIAAGHVDPDPAPVDVPAVPAATGLTMTSVYGNTT